MRRPLMPLLLIALLGVPLAVCAQVYKWKDAHGTVHFSDTPPPHGVAYTIVKTNLDMGKDSGAVNRGPNSENSEDAEDAAGSAQAPLADTAANRKQVCDRLEANIKLLSGSGPVITKDANGKSQVMSQQDRTRELAAERKQQAQYCR